MSFTKSLIFVVIFTFATNKYCTALDTPAQYESKITFYVYNGVGTMNSTFENNATLLAFCNPLENYTVIVHGWTESLNSLWTTDMIKNFTQSRGGCVFFMDYSKYSKESYYTLYTNFNGIRTVLTKKLLQLDQLGFNCEKGFAFGFSFGAPLVFEGLYQFNQITKKKFARADCCDPAALYFPKTSIYVQHAKDCAANVQCIHTSCGTGTCERYCPWDINMGDCGKKQIGETSPPLLSHGMCPHMYNIAFTLDYQFCPKPSKCTVTAPNVAPNITGLGLQVMGHRFNTNLPKGMYYSPTGKPYPWTVSNCVFA